MARVVVERWRWMRAMQMTTIASGGVVMVVNVAVKHDGEMVGTVMLVLER